MLSKERRLVICLEYTKAICKAKIVQVDEKGAEYLEPCGQTAIWRRLTCRGTFPVPKDSPLLLFRFGCWHVGAFRFQSRQTMFAPAFVDTTIFYHIDKSERLEAKMFFNRSFEVTVELGKETIGDWMTLTLVPMC